MSVTNMLKCQKDSNISNITEQKHTLPMIVVHFVIISFLAKTSFLFTAVFYEVL